MHLQNTLIHSIDYLEIGEKHYLTFCKNKQINTKRNMFCMKCMFCAFINTTIMYTDCVHACMCTILVCMK